MADEMAQVGEVDLAPAFRDENRIQRAQKVGRRVDQRAVEIENESWCSLWGR